jgi:DNA-binding HxlR family transcriptional regulator
VAGRLYAEFCPVARALDVLGERWTLLIVRDLVLGPQRFSELERRVVGITPKWLTHRLRSLTEAGIVERQSEPGRREVRYALTAKGRALEPVLDALAMWSVTHDFRPPADDEFVRPEHDSAGMATFLNQVGLRLPGPLVWELDHGDDERHAVRYDPAAADGRGRWSFHLDPPADGEADVVLRIEPRAWAELLVAAYHRSGQPDIDVELTGSPAAKRLVAGLLGLDGAGLPPSLSIG